MAYAYENGHIKEYSVVIDARGKQITGICMMNMSEDGTIVGTIVNEFGIRAFDFTFNGKIAKILNVFSPINKWYIRKVLRKDITFLLLNFKKGKNVAKDKRTMTVSSSGEIILENNRYNLRYTFKSLDEKQ